MSWDGMATWPSEVQQASTLSGAFGFDLVPGVNIRAQSLEAGREPIEEHAPPQRISGLVHELARGMISQMPTPCGKSRIWDTAFHRRKSTLALVD
jgi:hypothetical protein